MVTLYVLALLCVGDELLLLRRHNASFGDGLYSIPGGKVELDETALQAISREVAEEVGLTLPESAFTLVHTFHRKGVGEYLIALCFIADATGMHPKNMEPEKHDDMKFVALNELPGKMIPAHKQALECITRGIPYSQHGWE